MRANWSVVCLVALIPTAAQARPDSRTMTCGEAAALVQGNGAALLQTGQRRYDLYLASPAACSLSTERAVAQSVPTLDNPKCRIGYLCEPRARFRNR